MLHPLRPEGECLVCRPVHEVAEPVVVPVVVPVTAITPPSTSLEVAVS